MSPPRVEQRVEQAALDSIGGLAVREYLRVDFLDVEPGPGRRRKGAFRASAPSMRRTSERRARSGIP